MKRFYDIATRCFRMPALIAGIFLLIAGAVACSEKKAPDVPKEQSDLLFETFRDLEQKNYESALPKLKRYQEIDRTNVLIDHMINQVTTNVYVVQLRSLLEQGNFAEAEKLMRTMLAEHDELEDRVQLKDFASRLNGVDQLIRKLEPVQNSESLRNNAEHLRREAKSLPGSQKIIAYAERKLKSADELEKIEKDRTNIWPWLDALDAKNSDDKERAELLRIYVAALYLDGFGEPIVRELAP